MTGGIAISGVSYAFGARQALEDVSFDVAPGRFCALLGPNGAGKTTLFNLLTRLYSAPEGRISIAGHELSAAPLKALAALGVVFQQTTLDLDLTVRQNLRYFAALHGLSGREATLRIEGALDRLAISDRADDRARALNGGHRRRVEIARALLHRPKVMLLDEATVGLDAATRAGITAHVHDLCAEEGLTVLWATHLTDEVRDADDLVILHKGRIAASGTAGALRGALPLHDHFLALTGAGMPA